MADDFQYDVFLSHSAQDKEVVRAVAERLRGDGLRVWLDEWEIPSDVPLAHRMGEGSGVRAAKIEAGLEHYRVLVLCMSAHAFGSDPGAPGLEGGTFRFRDPLNLDRRFIPLRLDDAPIKASLAQFLECNWSRRAASARLRSLSYPTGRLLDGRSTPVSPPEVRRRAIATGVRAKYHSRRDGLSWRSNPIVETPA